MFAEIFGNFVYVLTIKFMIPSIKARMIGRSSVEIFFMVHLPARGNKVSVGALEKDPK